MFGKYILYIIGIISIIWIGYVGMDIIDKENQFSPTTLFGEKDGEILIINRLSENPFQKTGFETTPENKKIINALTPWLGKDDLIIISKKQSHIFIDNKENWTKEAILKLFKNAKLPIQFNQFKSFSSNKYNGKYAQSILYLSTKSVVKSKNKFEWSIHDSKASANNVKFNNNQFSITDIYIKGDDKIEYISLTSNISKGKQIEDEQLFSIALPNSISNYHFYEKSFYASLDSRFKKSPLNEWIENGFIEFNYNNNKVIISDYIDGQNPILVLNDLIQNQNESDKEEEGEFKNIQLTKNFPSNIQEGFFIKLMDDFVVISESKNTCEQVVADYRLGNTLALKKERLNYFYSDLPQKVSERYIEKDIKYSKTRFKNKIFETHLKAKEVDANNPSEKSSISMQVGLDIEDFIVLNGKGNIIILTKNGELLAYKNGQKSWHKEIKGYPFGEIREVEINDRKNYIVTTSKEIHLFNKDGVEENGFPIQLQTNATNEATYFNNKGTNCLAIANEKNELIIYNFKGKIISNIKSGLTLIKKPIDIWTSKKIMFIGAKDEYNYAMFNLVKKKEYRRFAIPTNTYSISQENELVQFAMESNDLVKIDQKGNKSIVKSFPGGKILKTSFELENPLIVIQAGNEVIYMNAQSEIYTRQLIDFGQLDNVSISENYGAVYLSVIDGIGNNIYLYNNNERINKKAFDGKHIVKTSFYNSKTLVTTIVDEFIVQYTMN
ncbi:MAG: hypothetical protein LW701_05270 [Fluviicola sp.]|nr:hypothetical protein [Fluviicola sp.]